MPNTEPLPPAPLPPATEAVLNALVRAAREGLGDELLSIVLFGSAAEGRLRPSSDLNLLFVLSRYSEERIDILREPLRMARMAQRAAVLFVVEKELPDFAESFAVKFDDLQRRHRVLHGKDLLSGLSATREARIQRLHQMLLNLILRLRERYASLSLRDEQLVEVVNEVVSPLRAAAATLLELEARGAENAREALGTLVREELSQPEQVLERIAQARKTNTLPAGQGAPLLLQFMHLVEKLQARLEALK